MTTETEIVAQSLENFIAEKESLAQRELELLTQLKAALNRLGYDLLPLDPEATPPITTRPADPSTQPQRRRGRPRKKPLESGPADITAAPFISDSSDSHDSVSALSTTHS